MYFGNQKTVEIKSSIMISQRTCGKYVSLWNVLFRNLTNELPWIWQESLRIFYWYIFSCRVDYPLSFIGLFQQNKAIIGASKQAENCCYLMDKYRDSRQVVVSNHAKSKFSSSLSWLLTNLHDKILFFKSK